MTAQQLDYNTLPLTGVRIIEASAGTGKTFTIAKLYLRALLALDGPTEEPLTPKQILVVTFTKAATKELRDRIRAAIELQLLAIDEQLWQQDKQTFDILHLAAARYGQPKDGEVWLPKLWLTESLRRIDEAEVHTIHSFCLQLLQQYAMDSKLPFGLEVTDASQLKRTAIYDYWRHLFYNSNAKLAEVYLAAFANIDAFSAELNSLLGYDALKIDGALDSLQEAVDIIDVNNRDLVHEWQQRRDDIYADLKAAEKANWLTKASWKPGSIERRFAEMNAWADHDKPLPLKTAEFFGESRRAKAVKKSGTPLPSYVIHDKMDQHLAQSPYESLKATLLNEGLHYVRQRLRAMQLDENLISNDDILVYAAHFINSASTATLEELRTARPIAMIDEFQDTDPHQYQVFGGIYPAHAQHSGMILIGDPKQSIYGFRGADLNVYLSARSNTTAPDGEFTMSRNYRSSPALVEALNQLFLRQQNTFKNPLINYVEVDSGTAPSELYHHDQSLSCIEFCHLDKQLKQSARESFTQYCVEATANRIAELLDGHHRLGDQPVTEGDIAVLVRSHNQAESIRNALSLRGVKSVTRARQSVYESAEAVALLQLIRAIEQPESEQIIRSALGSSLLNYSATELSHWFDDPHAWSTWLETLIKAKELWLWQGPMSALHHLMNSWKISERMLGQPAGERRMSNLMQLIELCHQQAQKHSGIETILSWLEHQIQDPTGGEDEQLRLESDDRLVQIVTIHASKGLQYPIVFCPFLWKPQQKSKGVAVYHQQLDLHAGYDDGAKDQQLEEANEELMRLFYVAATRAEAFLHFCYPEDKNSPFSPLGYLLNLPDASLAALNNLTQNELSNYGFRSYAASNDWIASLPESNLALTLKARDFTRPIDRTKRITSYSALIRNLEESKLVKFDDDELILPSSVVTAEVEASLSDTVDDRRFTLAKGAHVGNFLHLVLERHLHDIDNADIPSAMQRYGVEGRDDEETVAHYSRWLYNIVNTPIDQSFSLAQLEPEKTLSEMEFLLPLKGHMSSQSLASAMSDELRLALNFDTVSGHLNGFIDLIYERNGRYYVADYKSNHLGHWFDDYSAEHLAQAVHKKGYTLQFLIYSIALIRHLKQTLPNFDYDTHFGGVYYFYLRGMHPEHPGAGVYFYRPSLDEIVQLDNLFGTEDEQ